MMTQWQLITKIIGSSFVLISLDFYLVCVADANAFASIANMEKILKIQGAVIKDIQNRMSVLNDEKRRCVQMYLTQSQTEYSKAMDDRKKFLENPINAYKLVKRLTEDLKYIGNTTGWSFKKYQKPDHETFALAPQQHLEIGSEAILTLQVVYKLNLTELADGILRGNFSPPMTSTDCHKLGTIAYLNSDFELSLDWLKEALRKYQENGPDDCNFNLLNTMLSISLLYNVTDDLGKSQYWLNKSLSNGANESKLIEYERKLIETRILEKKKPRILRVSKSDKNPMPYDFLWNDIQSGLCSTERWNYKRLTCLYRYGPHPFLRLARFKVERLHLEPEIVRIYDVISDDEISVLQKWAGVKFQEPKDIRCEGGYEHFVRVRKSACLDYSLSDTIKTVSIRATDINGFGKATRVRAINYGVAGYQARHEDCNIFEDTYDQCSMQFNTILFYFNEVSQGGATIFPELDLSVFPVKNSALYWNNLDPSSGKQDRKLEHAACPVLYGKKWIGLKRFAGNTPEDFKGEEPFQV